MLFCLVAVAANAYSLSGKVKTDSLSAIPYVSVYLKDVHMGTTTDLDGKYELKDIPAGKHTLVVSYVGYETQTFDFTLEKDGYRDFTLHEQSITLDDVFITPNGESIQIFILNQVVKNTKKLKDRVSSYQGYATARFEQKNNTIKDFVSRYKAIEIAMDMLLGTVGYKKIFHCMMDHPDLRVEMAKDITFDGKIRASATRVTSCTPSLTATETEAWAKKDWRMNENLYDGAYQMMAKIKAAYEKKKKKEPEKAEKIINYEGAYHENGNTVHVISLGKDKDKSEFHIVDDVWQIRRISTLRTRDDKTTNMEFQAFSKTLYMPVSYFDDEEFMDMRKECVDLLKELEKEDTSKMSEKKLKQHQEDIAMVKRHMNADASRKRASLSFNYKNLKMK